MAAFKKTFLSPEQLQRFGPLWAFLWQKDVVSYQQGRLHPAEFCTRMVFQVYQSLFGERFRNGRRHESFIFPQGDEFRGLNELARFRIRGLPRDAELALLRWAQGEINLQVFERLPAPVEVLELQKQGVRCVSVFHREEEILSFCHEGRDFFSFLVHDLIHAQLMTADFESYQMQIKCAQILSQEWSVLNQGLRAEALRELEYLASDMNSHIVHLTQTFKSWLERHRPDLCRDEFKWMRSFQKPSLEPKRKVFQRLWGELEGPQKERAQIELYEFWKVLEF